jgi:hypothetical protein
MEAMNAEEMMRKRSFKSVACCAVVGPEFKVVFMYVIYFDLAKYDINLRLH